MRCDEVAQLVPPRRQPAPVCRLAVVMSVVAMVVIVMAVIVMAVPVLTVPLLATVGRVVGVVDDGQPRLVLAMVVDVLAVVVFVAGVRRRLALVGGHRWAPWWVVGASGHRAL